MSITNIKLKTDVISQITTELHKTDKVKEMKETKSIEDLILENEALEARNEFLEKCVKALKLNLSKTTQERNQLCDKLHEIQNLSMFEFGNRYCSSESLEADGHAFARSLGIGVDNAEDDFIAQGEKHYNDTWNIACGDDFK